MASAVGPPSGSALAPHAVSGRYPRGVGGRGRSRALAAGAGGGGWAASVPPSYAARPRRRPGEVRPASSAGPRPARPGSVPAPAASPRRVGAGVSGRGRVVRARPRPGDACPGGDPRDAAASPAAARFPPGCGRAARSALRARSPSRPAVGACRWWAGAQGVVRPSLVVAGPSRGCVEAVWRRRREGWRGGERRRGEREGRAREGWEVGRSVRSVAEGGVGGGGPGGRGATAGFFLPTASPSAPPAAAAALSRPLLPLLLLLVLLVVLSRPPTPTPVVCRPPLRDGAGSAARSGVVRLPAATPGLPAPSVRPSVPWPPARAPVPPLPPARPSLSPRPAHGGGWRGAGAGGGAGRPRLGRGVSLRPSSARSPALARALRGARPSETRPQIRRGDPLNLSILVSGGKETNQDSLSNGE